MLTYWRYQQRRGLNKRRKRFTNKTVYLMLIGIFIVGLSAGCMMYGPDVKVLDEIHIESKIVDVDPIF